MWFAREAPQGAMPDRKRSARRIRLTVEVAVLFALILVFIHRSDFFLSPHGLFERAYDTAVAAAYDPKPLGQWSEWDYKCDGKLNSDNDAVACANQMLASLKDQYSFMLKHEKVVEEHKSERGDFAGLGIEFRAKVSADGESLVKNAKGEPMPDTDSTGAVFVKDVVEGSPAEAAGVKVGDALATIDGAPVAGMSMPEVLAALHKPEGTAMALGMKRQGAVLTVNVARQVFIVPAVTAKMLPGQIAYVRLMSFDREQFGIQVSDKVDRLLRQGARGVVVDVRNNPGGRVTESIDVASLFIKTGTVVVVKEREGGDRDNPTYAVTAYSLKAQHRDGLTAVMRHPDGNKDEAASDRYPYIMKDLPVVILVNGGTASAAELFTGAVKDNGTATVVGTRTFGKGIGQSIIPMPHGTELHITSLRYFTPSGAWLGDGGNSVNQGINPDLVVEPRVKFFTQGGDDDTQLQEAVRLLNAKLSAH